MSSPLPKTCSPTAGDRIRSSRPKTEWLPGDRSGEQRCPPRAPVRAMRGTGVTDVATADEIVPRSAGAAPRFGIVPRWDPPRTSVPTADRRGRTAARWNHHHEDEAPPAGVAHDDRTSVDGAHRRGMP